MEARILAPLVSVWVLFLGIVAYAIRHPAPLPPATVAPRRRSIVATAAGGYAVFVAIVVVFHVWLAGERQALASALWGGAFLIACGAVPVLLRSLAGRR